MGHILPIFVSTFGPSRVDEWDAPVVALRFRGYFLLFTDRALGARFEGEQGSASFAKNSVNSWPLTCCTICGCQVVWFNFWSFSGLCIFSKTTRKQARKGWIGAERLGSSS